MFDDWSDPEDMEEQEELEASLRRFQQMVEHDGHAFFDEDEYIFIIDHYMSLDELDMAERAISNALERYPDNVPLILRHVGLLSARQKMDAALTGRLYHTTLRGQRLIGETAIDAEARDGQCQRRAECRHRRDCRNGARFRGGAHARPYAWPAGIAHDGRQRVCGRGRAPSPSAGRDRPHRPAREDERGRGQLQRASSRLS